MSSVISAGTTSGTALNMSGDTSGNLAFQTQAGTYTITVPNETGTLLTNKTAGTVLQVVNATYSTDTSSTSSTFADTGLTASITPKFSTSKILVLVSINGQEKANNTYAGFQLVRNSTAIAQMEYEAGYTGTSTTNAVGSNSIEYLDSPATTSSTTYKVQFKSGANISYIKICSSGAVSTITLMEIAA